MLKIRFLILLFALIHPIIGYTEIPRINHSAKSKQPPDQKTSNSQQYPFFVQVVPKQQTKQYPNAKEQTEKQKLWIDKLLAGATILLAIFTGGLWLVTYCLARDAKETSKRQADEIKKLNRAFIHLDGFNVELTPATKTKASLESLPEIYRDRPELYITRFAIQPRWKNSGNTPTKELSIQVNWHGASGEAPEFIYSSDAKKMFIGPQATEGSEFIEIPSVQQLVDAQFETVSFKKGKEPKIFIWGRADYKDIFNVPHFIEWCYLLRLDDHKGEGLRASFIQWSEYNRSDE